MKLGLAAWLAVAGAVAVSTATTAESASADERVGPAARWIAMGYRRVEFAKPGSFGLAGGHARAAETPPWPAHSLEWPVHFEDAAHQIGNSMAEYQVDYDGPYYHGGCDLRVARAAEVRTPVAGRVEAGHYAYSDKPDGSMEKFWYPWPHSGSTAYFEVAVVTDEGYRFEFHHMDETRLSDEVMAILRSGSSGRVAAGTSLGATIPWNDGVYHHTHYNIITPSGVRLNPEYYSLALKDAARPEIRRALAVFAGSRTEDFGTGRFASAPEYFAVAGNDRLDDDAYVHPPAYAAIRFDSGESFAWDFRERLLGPDGKFPPIWDFFVRSLATPDDEELETSGGYGEGLSVIRLPVPQGARGPFAIRLADEAGNESVLQGEIAR
jgi:hypothetical protein